MAQSTLKSVWFYFGNMLVLAACSSERLPETRDGSTADARVIVKLDGKREPTAGSGMGGATGDSAHGGATGDAAGGAPTDASAVVPACHTAGGPCNTAIDYCCAGFSCGSTSLEPGYHCLKNCSAHSECATGCCAPLGDTSITVCLDPLFCPAVFCHQAEQTCLDGLPCCEGLACAVFGTTTESSACKPVCTDHGDCATGCCAPLGDSGTQVCLEQSFCPSVFCLAEDVACQGGLPCCEGLVCALFATTPRTSACKPVCKENKDCATGCCVSLGADYPSACLDRTFCTTSP